MDEIDRKTPEEWSSFQRRVIAAESFYKRKNVPHLKEASVVAVILGIIITFIHPRIIYSPAIFQIGLIIAVLGVTGFIVNYWVSTGSGTMDKERQKSIQDRGTRERCMYLKGALPDGLSPAKGSCELYNKTLETYPYCMYCKSYRTDKMGEEEKLKVKIK